MTRPVVDVPLLLERLGIEGKRRGPREIWACCPLPGHEERTPSFQIRDDPEGDKHGFWRCLGQCHEGGGPTALVSRVFGCSFEEAIDWIKNERLGSPRHFLRMELQEAPPLPSGFVLPGGATLSPLPTWVAPARAYAERRGITAEQVDKWGLGYAVDGRLAGRIILPWRDSFGKLTGYTARTYLASNKKYLEPDASEGADRSAIYGEQHWPPVGDARRTVVVVEGGIDGLAVERATAFPFAAVCGSVLLPGHVARLSTWREVIIASDPDKAGRGLAEALRGALARWVRIRDATLPSGYDCAKVEAEKGKEELQEIIESAPRSSSPPRTTPV